ncbi:MAG: hypothetical protein U9N55_03945 [candidate division Zixibacteria bacterium]|nr:hypothetical protein [candidate division Zixibacteria bacterium]
MQPYKIDLSQLTDKVIDEAEFTISNVSEEKLNIKMIDYCNEMFDVELPDSIDPRMTVKAVVKLKENAINESFDKSFTIELSDQNKSRFTVPVKRMVRHTINKSTNTRKLDRGK